MNTTELQAGRELDVRVAERVMGWKVRKFWPVSDARVDRSSPCEEWVGPDGARSPYHQPPRYSTDIAAAWEVVEKLTAAGVQVVITNHDERLHLFDGRYRVDVDSYEAEAETAPLAICLAALKAIGENPNG